jgi:hypothetical protein
MASRAPIIDASSALGKRAIGFEIASVDHERLAAEAKRRRMATGEMFRHIATRLAQRPELIATVLGEFRATGGAP